jgi:hypothetical protein
MCRPQVQPQPMPCQWIGCQDEWICATQEVQVAGESPTVCDVHAAAARQAGYRTLLLDKPKCSLHGPVPTSPSVVGHGDWSAGR